jgi:hypothetical protein
MGNAYSEYKASLEEIAAELSLAAHVGNLDRVKELLLRHEESRRGGYPFGLLRCDRALKQH